MGLRLDYLPPFHEVKDHIDAALHKSFALPREMALDLEVDALKAWNKVQFSNPTSAWATGSTTFGTIASIANSPRDSSSPLTSASEPPRFTGHILT